MEPSELQVGPDFDSIKSLILEVAQDDPIETRLNHLVGSLAQRPDVALVRIWVLRKGDICNYCPMQSECPDRTLCLHLIASAGRPISKDGESWNNLEGDFRRIPIGARLLGHIAKTGKEIAILNMENDPDWPDHSPWAKKENVRAFSGVPLLHKKHVVGVFGIYSRRKIDEKFLAEAVVWQRLVADFITSSVAKHRAFEELHQLNHQLTMEKEFLLEEVVQCQGFKDIIGQSAPMKELYQQISRVSMGSS